MLINELKTLFAILIHPRKSVQSSLLELRLKMPIVYFFLLLIPNYIGMINQYFLNSSEISKIVTFLGLFCSPFLILKLYILYSKVLIILIKGRKNAVTKLTKREKRQNPDVPELICFEIVLHDGILGLAIGFPFNTLDLIFSFSEKLPFPWLIYLFSAPVLFVRIIWLYHVLHPVFIDDKTKAKKIIAKYYILTLLATAGLFLAFVIAVFIISVFVFRRN